MPKNDVGEFSYDYSGKRVKKVTNGLSTIYIDSLFEIEQGQPLAAAGTAPNKTRKHIFAGANRVCTITAQGLSPSEASGSVPELLYYYSDHLGSSNVITDANGTQVEHYEYTPYGGIAVQDVSRPSSLVHHKFTGKELDLSGLYYYEARYYSPALGRFITPDPINYSDEGIKAAGGKDLTTFLKNPLNLNRYSYCRNNPLNSVDPYGFLTIYIPGTFSGYDLPSNDYLNALTNTFNEKYGTYALTTWSFFPSGNTNLARLDAILPLADFINSYRFSGGEKLNIVGYSHGGNVALILSQMNLRHKIDNLVLLGAPIREYAPNMRNVGRIFNFYSNRDWVQRHGGRDAWYGFFFPGEAGESRQTLQEAMNINVPIPRGIRDVHSYLSGLEVWQDSISEIIERYN